MEGKAEKINIKITKRNCFDLIKENINLNISLCVGLIYYQPLLHFQFCKRVPKGKSKYDVCPHIFRQWVKIPYPFNKLSSFFIIPRKIIDDGKISPVTRYRFIHAVTLTLN